MIQLLKLTVLAYKCFCLLRIRKYTLGFCPVFPFCRLLVQDEVMSSSFLLRIIFRYLGSHGSLFFCLNRTLILCFFIVLSLYFFWLFCFCVFSRIFLIAGKYVLCMSCNNAIPVASSTKFISDMSFVICIASIYTSRKIA